MKLNRRLNLAMVICVLFLFCLTINVDAATLTVNKIEDTNDNICDTDCSLREAISVAVNGDTIAFSSLFNSSQIITLSGSNLLINKDLTINGTGANLITVSGNRASRVFAIDSGVTVNISGLTMSGGNGFGVGAGGGAIHNQGTTTLTSCYIKDSTSLVNGGGISNHGTLNVIRSTISGNQSQREHSGGGISNHGGTINLINSTVSGNRSINIFHEHSGGIWSMGTMNIFNSTITNNYSTSTSTTKGIRSFGVTTVRSSIIAGNGSTMNGYDLSGNFVSLGYNLIGRVGSQAFNQTGDQTGTVSAPLDPLLLPLAMNGGTVPTHGFRINSPAIDKGKSFGEVVDQRNQPRIFDNPNIINAEGGDGTDIGAFEVQSELVAVSISGRVISTSNRGINNAFVSLTLQNGETRIVPTNPFGYFRFQEVQAGETYIINAQAKRYIFQPLTLTVTNEIPNLIITAEK